MALKVTCPNCGPRPYTEFWFGGERPSHVAHAAPVPDDVDDDFRRVWLKTNAAGLQSESWFHHAGCRRWLRIQRDTLTNEFHGRA
jgi:heterotetrameric sarcosine oxidase delta subunit